jgi:catechol 2,3-dioxygenase
MRPELGASLDHLAIRSPDPERLARFFEEVYGMAREPHGDGWKCAAPGRVFLLTPGKANSLAFFALGFANEEAFQRHRARVAGGANISPLFDARALSATDPDGNVVAFGPRTASSGSDQPLPARLQHLAFRTAHIEAMLAFYVDQLGFVLSDRVEDAEGTLRACFLRSDEEHHVLALFRSTESRFDHVSCETPDITRLIGWADRIAARRVPIHWGIGRHGPGNDAFFMVKDPDDNLIEISAELERVDASRPAGTWPHEQRTLNLWGSAIMRS